MYTYEATLMHCALMLGLLNRDKGIVMLLRGLIAISTLIFALSLTGCGERETAKEDTDEVVSTQTEKTTSETAAPSNAPEVKKEESTTSTTTATTPAPEAAPAAAPEATAPKAEDAAKPAEAAPTAPADSH